MDSLSIIVMLLIAFLGLQQGIHWLFIGVMFLTAVIAKNWGLRIIIVLGTAAMYLLNLSQYWFVLFAVIAGLTILLAEKTGDSGGGGEEAYSPELMRMLGG